MKRLGLILKTEAEHLQFDRRTLEAFKNAPEMPTEDLAATLCCGRHTLATSLARLGRRELI